MRVSSCANVSARGANISIATAACSGRRWAAGEYSIRRATAGTGSRPQRPRSASSAGPIKAAPRRRPPACDAAAGGEMRYSPLQRVRIRKREFCGGTRFGIRVPNPPESVPRCAPGNQEKHRLTGVTADERRSRTSGCDNRNDERRHPARAPITTEICRGHGRHVADGLIGHCLSRIRRLHGGPTSG